MAVGNCAILGCENRGAPGNDSNFFRIPKNSALAAQWLKYCKEGTSATQGRVCSNHFTREDYNCTDKRRHYLNRNAIPSIGVEAKTVTLFISTPKDEQVDSENSAGTPIETITKQKLEGLLYTCKFCSVCLDRHGQLHDFKSKVDIVQSHQDIGGSLLDIVREMFGKMSSQLPSTYLCGKCTETVINNYIFVQKAKQAAKSLQSYVDDLLFQVDDTAHKLCESSDINHVILTVFDTDLKVNGNLENALDDLENIKNDFENTKKDFENIKDDFQKTKDDCENTTYEVDVAEDNVEDDVPSDGENSYLNISKEQKMKYSVQCPDCQIDNCIHGKYLKWFNHQELSGETEIKCPDCDNVYTTRYLYIEHVNNHHLKVPKMSCDQCNRIFYSKSYFSAHVRKYHRKTLECVHCEAKFKKESSLDYHLKDCLLKKRPFLCVECPASFDSQERLDAHKSKKHSQTYACNMCLFKTRAVSGLKYHKNTTHGLGLQCKAIYTDCTVCHKVFKRRQELIVHMKSHPADSTHICKMCNKEFKTQQLCRGHVKHVHLKTTSVRCPVCDEKVYAGALSAHMKIHTENGTTPYLCQHCGKYYSSRSALHIHMKDHGGLVACPICSTMLQPSSMKTHLCRHKGFEKDADLQYKQNLRKQKYFCDECNYHTASPNYIESHINRFHLKIHPYVCEVCNKAFAGKHLLRIHQQVHQDVTTFPCNSCEKVFRQRLGLKMHIRSAHTGEKPFCCDICGESFISASLLRRHKRKKHETIKRIDCPLCDISLLNISDVRRHIKRLHWKGEGKFKMADVPGLTKEDLDRLEDLRRTSYGWQNS